MRATAVFSAIGIAVVSVLAGCGSDASSMQSGESGGPVVPAPSHGSATGPVCSSLPSAATLAAAAKYDGASPRLVADSGLCVLVVDDRRVVNFGVAPGDRRAKLRSIGYRNSGTVPGAVEGGSNVAVVHDGKTYSVGIDDDRIGADDAHRRDLSLLRAWGKI